MFQWITVLSTDCNANAQYDNHGRSKLADFQKLQVGTFQCPSLILFTRCETDTFQQALCSCDRASWAVWREIKPKRCNNQMFIINFCLNMFWGIIMPIFRRTKTVCYCIWCVVLVLLDVDGSGCGALRCRMSTARILQRSTPTTATNHIQQNQNNTPNAVTGPLISWRWL